MPRSLQVCRVWDALFSEGSKILFRTALAVLKAQEDALLAYDNAGAPSIFTALSGHRSCRTTSSRVQLAQLVQPQATCCQHNILPAPNMSRP